MMTTGKLIGMIKLVLLVSGVLAFCPGASNDFEKRSLEGSKRRLLRRARRGVCFLRRSAPTLARLRSSNCSGGIGPRTRHKDVPAIIARDQEPPFRPVHTWAWYIFD